MAGVLPPFPSAGRLVSRFLPTCCAQQVTLSPVPQPRAGLALTETPRLPCPVCPAGFVCRRLSSGHAQLCVRSCRVCDTYRGSCRKPLAAPACRDTLGVCLPRVPQRTAWLARSPARGGPRFLLLLPMLAASPPSFPPLRCWSGRAGWAPTAPAHRLVLTDRGHLVSSSTPPSKCYSETL